MAARAVATGKPCNNTTVSTATGLTPTTVGRYVKGQFSQLDVETLGRLAVYFEVSSIAALIDFEALPAAPLERPLPTVAIPTQ
jgi:hypothetical protein